MKQTLFTFCFILSTYMVFSQVQKISGASQIPVTVNVSDKNVKDFHPNLICLDQHPLPASEYGNKKQELYLLQQERAKNNNTTTPAKLKTRGVASNPTITKGIQGNTSNSTPNDNDIAVSNNGTIVNVVNSNLRVYDDTGKILVHRSLSSIFAAAGTYTWISDPRVIYDAKNDRFILVCFSGSLSNESTILVGFTQTNDPTQNWNVYTLNGNSFNDSTWSDYPIIAITDKDLFMTFNQVKDNVSWTVGFKQSVIWQIQKQEGYAGTPLVYDLWSNITYNGGYLRNICPTKYQTTTMPDNIYFLTVRNVASTNDSIFVTEITNSKSSGVAQINQRVLTTPTPYGFPPNVKEKLNQHLMTNDARVLAAIYENDYIHFGSNTIEPTNLTAGVYLGTIKNISNTTPTVTGEIFSSPTLQYGYPSMTFLGDETSTPHKILYTFSHCYTDSFPGTSMLYKNANGDYSDIVSVKDGASIINRLTDSIERWGDYTNIQKMYNNYNRAYLAGSWGKTNMNNCWVAMVDNTDFPLQTNPLTNEKNKSEVYPNPINENRFTTHFYLTEAQYVKYEIFNLQGQRVALLLDTHTKQGSNEFSFTTNDLAIGNYIFKISTQKEIIATHKITIE